MDWLNYHHLHYFWTVAHEGSVSGAARRLRLSQPTISAQLKALEESLGEALFVRRGRTLVLTEVGRLVLGYADEIFSLGQELREALRGVPTTSLPLLHAGVADTLPKMAAGRLLAAAGQPGRDLRLVCREGPPDALIAQLALHALDVVLSDAPHPPGLGLKAVSHPLGDCPVVAMAAPALARRLAKGFPHSLDGAPVLLPAHTSALHRELRRWFDELGVVPDVAGEFDDSALLKVFGQQGAGVFFVPSVVREEVVETYGTPALGEAGTIRERFYAITMERRLGHPAVAALTKGARTSLFASGKK